ncbi:MAG: TetR family transcriptional regulator [Rhodospirillales bacterium 20-64-7]|nr:MAG: TetR family transcriptional regulator [Rhodospirillales bacterium 20-64-7]HQT79112.1 TetR/AcrR family transcriptional regulator [Rhodopila sp.]
MPRPRSINDDIVLDRVLEVFWRSGYAGTSMRDLSQATGLGAAALYHRFGDKDGIFVEAVRRYADEGLIERLSRLSAVDDPVEAIATFFDELIAMSVADPDRRGCLLVNTALDGAAMSDAARALVQERLGQVETFFRDQLQRAQHVGCVGPDMQPDMMAEALFGTVLAIRVLARLAPDHGRLRRLADNALKPLASAKTAARQ